MSGASGLCTRTSAASGAGRLGSGLNSTPVALTGRPHRPREIPSRRNGRRNGPEPPVSVIGCRGCFEADSAAERRSVLHRPPGRRRSPGPDRAPARGTARPPRRLRRHRPALRAPVRRGAEVVAAGGAEAFLRAPVCRPTSKPPSHRKRCEKHCRQTRRKPESSHGPGNYGLVERLGPVSEPEVVPDRVGRERFRVIWGFLITILSFL